MAWNLLEPSHKKLSETVREGKFNSLKYAKNAVEKELESGWGLTLDLWSSAQN